MPDAGWWDAAERDEFGGVKRDVASLEAEVRRLRGVLLRVRDQLEGAKSWEQLKAAAAMAKVEAERALSHQRRKL